MAKILNFFKSIEVVSFLCAALIFFIGFLMGDTHAKRSDNIQYADYVSPDRQYFEAQQIIKENKEAVERANETMKRYDELYKFRVKGDKIYYGPAAEDFMGFRDTENDRTPILRVDENKTCKYLVVYKKSSTWLFYYGNRDVNEYWCFNLQPEDNWQFKFCDKNNPALVTIYDGGGKN